MKLSRFSAGLSGSILALCLGMAACTASGTGTIIPNPTPTATPFPTATPSASVSPTPAPTASPMPTPTPTPASSYAYSLPLIGMDKPECNGREQMIYDVEPDGSFRYYPGDYNPWSDEPGLELKQRQLTAAELQDLKALINQADLAKKFESSTLVPPGSPQTDECRTVLEFTLQVNGAARTYDANGRKYIHTEAYQNAIESLRQRLQDLSGIAPNS